MNDYDEMLRTAYATFAQGDLDGYLSYCTPDIRFTIPGNNQLSKTYSREEFGPGLIADVMRLSNGTFRETVLDVFTSARGGIVYAHHAFERDGRKHEYRTLHRYDIAGGKLASFREIPEDMDAFDAAWA
jgi:ketosteroid isomerase-like protein